MERRRLRPHKQDGGKQNGQRKYEGQAGHPGRPHNQGMIEPGSALRGDLYDPPDARPDDEIVGQGQKKKDRHEPQPGRQDLRLS